MTVGKEQTYSLAADVGGTFTDIVLLRSDGRVIRQKVSSTPPNFDEAIIEALNRMVSVGDINPQEIHEILHSTTAATNAILERQGATTALITTQGFKDVLEIGRMRRPSMFDTNWNKPQPLVPRHLRFEVSGRLDASGHEVEGLDREAVTKVAEQLIEHGAEAVAVSLINSYANPAHETIVRDVIASACPNIFISTSFEVLPEIKEYERTSTTVVNAYLHPLVHKYVDALQTKIRQIGCPSHLSIMQSNGGLMDASRARERPVYMVESGPAAGVRAAQYLGNRMDIKDSIAFDMGGTTAKATLIESGQAFEASDYEVGGEMSTSRLLRGGGYSVQVPSLDVSEVGAGGGSVCWLDDAGAPRVGPMSAGAVPGPACYGMGGDAPTLTDANLVLGYLSSEAIAGGTRSVHYDLASTAIETVFGSSLDLPLNEIAYGLYELGTAAMAKALRAVSMERGRDPREFVLFAFGGAGPMYAVALARAFHIDKVIVPPNAGLLSAVGLLAADVSYDYVTSYAGPAGIDLPFVAKSFETMTGQALDDLAASRSDGPRFDARKLDLRYSGQSFELSVPIPDGPIDEKMLGQARRDFDAMHERMYGHQVPEQEVELVNVRLRASIASTSRQASLDSAFGETPTAYRESQTVKRTAFFGSKHGEVLTPVLSRGELSRQPMAGPLIIEELDSTTVVPPDASAHLDSFGNIEISLHS